MNSDSSDSAYSQGCVLLEGSYYDPIGKFNLTAEGCLIEFLKSQEPSTLFNMEQHVSSCIELLRDPKGKKYVQSPEQLTRSTLIRNKQIFQMDQYENWKLIEQNLESFVNKQIRIILKYAKKNSEKNKDLSEIEKDGENSDIFRCLLEIDEISASGNDESQNLKRLIDEAYQTLFIERK
ncbi:unnamed protein product [Blepharisma stoltei]|uniref:Uncharacterized protein n=1 Tax=Blepharisma stoltei TaxID=1481888 RepID=A0AAU9ISV3_9CILI|nr:unnamed protein product [Blepharisma stoltei]